MYIKGFYWVPLNSSMHECVRECILCLFPSVLISEVQKQVTAAGRWEEESDDEGFPGHSGGKEAPLAHKQDTGELSTQWALTPNPPLSLLKTPYSPWARQRTRTHRLWLTLGIKQLNGILQHFSTGSLSTAFVAPCKDTASKKPDLFPCSAKKKRAENLFTQNSLFICGWWNLSMNV